MIAKTCDEISKSGHLSIVEGGSTTYFPSLYLENQKNPFISKIFALYFPNNFDVAKIIKDRINTALEEGLLNEVKIGMEKYPNSLIMNDCHFIVPMVRYLNKEINLAEARREVVHRCLGYISKQMDCFKGYPNIVWITHNPLEPSATVNKINKLLEN